MRRIKTVLGVVAVMAAMLVVFAAPAMANDHNDWDWNDRHDDSDSCWFFGVWVCDDDRDHHDDDNDDDSGTHVAAVARHRPCLHGYRDSHGRRRRHRLLGVQHD